VFVTKYRYKVLKGDVGLKVRELIKQTCEAFEIEILKSVVSLRIPVKAATQTAGMRPPKPLKAATLSERSDAGGLFLLYLVSCRQICLLFS